MVASASAGMSVFGCAEGRRCSRNDTSVGASAQACATACRSIAHRQHVCEAAGTIRITRCQPGNITACMHRAWPPQGTGRDNSREGACPIRSIHDEVGRLKAPGSRIRQRLLQLCAGPAASSGRGGAATAAGRQLRFPTIGRLRTQHPEVTAFLAVLAFPPIVLPIAPSSKGSPLLLPTQRLRQGHYMT